MPVRKGKSNRKLPLPKSGVVAKMTGRNGYIILDEQRRMVTLMRANGMTIDAISDVMGMCDDTLKKQFKLELDFGFNMIRSKMGAALAQAGLNGNVSAMKFWLANRCPEWRAASEGLNNDQPERDDEVVHFYLPPNYRDQPEERIVPIVIDGKAKAA